MNLKKHTTPEHLEALGIQVCEDCGKAMCFENTICYNCGWVDDDVKLHEQLLHQKHHKKWYGHPDLFLVSMLPGIYSIKRKYHLMEGNSTLCGKADGEMNIVGLLSALNLRKFKANGCLVCIKKFNNDYKL